MRQLSLRLFPLLLVAGCSSGGGDEGGAGSAGNGSGNNGGGGTSGSGGAFEPAPYNGVSFTILDVEIEATSKSGTQGKLMVASDGTLHYAYFKYEGPVPTCDIAVFGGGVAPGVNYELRLATKPPGGTWTVETVPLQNVQGATHAYANSLFGLDGLVEANTGDVLITVAAGAAGLFSCGSSDAVLARRAGTTWSFQTLAADSGECCGDCPDSACTAGTDMGAWSTITESSSGTLAAAFVDYHNFADEDGQSWQGFEAWTEGGSVFGVAPWSGRGLYSDSVFAGSTLIFAYTAFNGSGLYVARRTGTAGNTTDWTITNIQAGVTVGERISLAVAPDGTLGLAYNRKDSNDDLMYCESGDEGATWETCVSVDVDIQRVGGYPSLVFDAENRPLIAYYACGVSNCDNNVDGVRFAFRELNGQWKTKDVLFHTANKSGLYAQLVLDPTTGAPIIAFADTTRDAAMVATGVLPAP